MKKGDVSEKRGFTIIEVSLVLAIAGLIFLMVFVALPALRRSQRDTSRREDIMSFVRKVKDYQSNNRGALPGGSDKYDSAINVAWNEVQNMGESGNETTWKGFYRDYLGDKFADPNGENYKLTVAKCGALGEDSACTTSILSGLFDVAFPNDYRLLVVLQAKCQGETAVGSSNPRKLAVLYKLEGAGVYCNNT